jgi:cytochrome c1
MAETRRNEFARSDSWVQENDALRQRIADANELAAVPLVDEDVRALVAFLQALTDPIAARLDALVPASVPCGLPVED